LKHLCSSSPFIDGTLHGRPSLVVDGHMKRS
jgi:hypothetical protein